MEILKPYREKIDALDDRIVDLLAERVGIVSEVGHLKEREGISTVLQDRVDAVLDRTAARAVEKGLDPALVRALYTRIIDYSHDLEGAIAQRGARVTDTAD